MTDIKKLIEDEAGKYVASVVWELDRQIVSDVKRAYIAGALWAMRWWVERYSKYSYLPNIDYVDRASIRNELDAAAKQILGEK